MRTREFPRDPASWARTPAWPRPSARAGIAAWICLSAGLRCTHAAVPDAVVGSEPRAFGHFIGDRLTRHIEVTVPPGYRLVAGLPQPGRAGTWLELTHLTTDRAEVDAAARYRIDLDYQIVNSAPQPLLTVLPGIDLHFEDGRHALDRRSEDLPLAIAPLAPSGTSSLRPARTPRLIDAAPTQRRLMFSGAVTAVLLGGLALCVRGLPRRRQRAPFAAAVRSLRGLARAHVGVEADEAALRTVHRAFDATFGRRMFAEHLDRLIELNPHFADLRADAQRFFDLSRDTFFGRGASGGAGPLEWLAAMCADFAARERRAASRRRMG